MGELGQVIAVAVEGDARPVEPSGTPWTDDRAPVEWLTDRMIVSYAAEGGRLDEDFLPTRPR